MLAHWAAIVVSHGCRRLYFAHVRVCVLSCGSDISTTVPDRVVESKERPGH